jgi:hypothetical protein
MAHPADHFAVTVGLAHFAVAKRAIFLRVCGVFAVVAASEKGHVLQRVAEVRELAHADGSGKVDDSFGADIEMVLVPV